MEKPASYLDVGTVVDRFKKFTNCIMKSIIFAGHPFRQLRSRAAPSHSPHRRHDCASRSPQCSGTTQR
jgi:hypothetical protein